MNRQPHAETRRLARDQFARFERDKPYTPTQRADDARWFSAAIANGDIPDATVKRWIAEIMLMQQDELGARLEDVTPPSEFIR